MPVFSSPASKSLFALVLALALTISPQARAQNEPAGKAPTTPVEALAPLTSTPDDNLALGNPSQALSGPNHDPNNLLVLHPAFALSYNGANGGPNWVSWHLAQTDRGRTGRSENFRPDPLLPPRFQIRPNDYRNTGYDRGHQCPSGDRTADKAANASTFFMSNMLPQTPDLNRQLWRKFEEYCRTQLRSGENEIYLITGGTGSLERIAGGKINVPASCWKVAVILRSGDNDLKRIDTNTRVVSILVPNEEGEKISKGDWRDYLTSIDQIETLTQLDLLSNLPTELQNTLESRVDTGRATRQKANGQPDEDTNTTEAADQE